MAHRFSWLLSVQLRAQRRTAFELVESSREEVGYLDRGEFVWALGTRRGRGESPGQHALTWVSGDYEIDTNRLADFRRLAGIARRLGPGRLPRPRWR